MEDADTRRGGVHTASERCCERTFLRPDPCDACRRSALGGGETGCYSCEVCGVVLLKHEPGEVRRVLTLSACSDEREVDRGMCACDRGDRVWAHGVRIDDHEGIPGDAAQRLVTRNDPRHVDGQRAHDADAETARSRCRLLGRHGRRLRLGAAAAARSEQAGEHWHEAPHRAKPRDVRGGPFGPPLTNQLELRSVYLTVLGMPLILPALSFAYCAATAFLIDAGTFELHLP